MIEYELTIDAQVHTNAWRHVPGLEEGHPAGGAAVLGRGAGLQHQQHQQQQHQQSQ